MRVPLEWLHQFVRPRLDVAQLADRLTMTGTKVEAIHTHGVTALEHFVVGKVLRAEPHPDADRLRVCLVDVGDDAPSGIVCGAPNVAAGQTVAVAKPGAVMPDGTRLKAAKLRGQVSNGMILAEDEVAIGTDHGGIMVLDDGLAAGTRLDSVLPIATDVLELEITPNRPDCLSIYGVAREVHAATGATLAPPPWSGDPGSLEPGVPGVTVEVRDPDLCPRFTLRRFEDVAIGPSPPWLKARLMAAGQRPINNVVDITNYVMLLTGQPLHAFDADRVEGGRLVVRRAGAGEQVVTLDDVTRTLDDQMVVIDDAAGPTSIAGVMGGNRSEVHAGTTRVLMEAATWVGPNIQRTSNKLGLRSEASGRFDKQLSPGQTLEAQAVAAQLMVELTGARISGGTIDVDARSEAEKRDPVLRLREARVERLLGKPIAKPDQARILEALDFRVADAPDGLDVTVPHFRRADVTREVDLVEEVARIDGLDKLPATLPSRRGAVGVLAPEQRQRRRVEDALVGAGLSEVVGWSLTSRAAVSRLRSPLEPVAVRNPMSEEQAVMRTHVLGSLLDAAALNTRRGMPAVRLFEIGTVYLPWDDDRPRPPGRWDPPAGTRGRAAWDAHRLPDERTHAGALLTGPLRPASWRDSSPPAADFFAAKGVVEALGRALRVELAFVTERDGGVEPFLHPARGARVLAGPDGDPAGWVGEVHPAVAAAWDLEHTVAAFELDLAVLTSYADPVPAYRDLTSFPAVLLDLAVTVGEDVPAEAVLAVVRQAGGRLLERAEVFDSYRGAQVGEGRVSLALRLAFRAPDRTLTDDDVAAPRDKIVARLREELGGELRG
jgi:phenylalanyl-tRNA synthetase beta chain